jgi:Kef-type K+ transport system membrane component KefB
MNRLLKLTAIIEAAAGLALMVVPSVVVRLLLGSELDAPTAVMLGRVAGAALLALGVACWLARGDTQSRAARGLVAVMVLYNVAAVAVLAFVGIGFGLQGVALWPAVVLHAAMAVWCIACLRRSPTM